MIFESLDTYSKIYLIFAAVSTIIFVIKLILMLLGNDSMELDADLHSSHSHPSSDTAFVLFSVESILSFLMGFGWAGLTAVREWHLSKFVSISVAFVFGLLMMLFIAFLLMQVKKLTKTSEFKVNECIGKTGNAYTDLKKDTVGQIKITVAGKLRILNAINRSKEVIKAFSSVVVTDIEGNNLIVDEYNGGN